MSRRGLPRVDAAAVTAWALVGGVVLFMGLDGGGYDIVVHSQVGVAVWWTVLVCAGFGILRGLSLPRAAWVALLLFGGFVVWSAIATSWSLSSERSLQELSRVATYLGVLLLGLLIHRDGARSLRHTLHALAAVVVIVAALALISRLLPDLFPAARQTASYLPVVRGRLAWPLNYWNALAALIAFGLPLLLVVATSARTILAQVAGAAAIPILLLSSYLTFSRGGVIAAAAGLVLFFLLAPDRLPKLATALLGAAGGALLIVEAVHRSALERGIVDAAARRQGQSLLLAVILVCAGAGALQAGIGLWVRRATRPGWLTVSRQRARSLLVIAAVTFVSAGVLAGGPARLSHVWSDFKHPSAPALAKYSIGRFTSASGNGRYDWWTTALAGTKGALLTGAGPGTFQLVWLPKAPFFSYVQNAHSLYIETFSDLGLIGIGLLSAFFAVVLGAAIRLAGRSHRETRAQAAGAAAALTSFALSAGIDWIWQVPALPAAFLLLAAAVLATSVRRDAMPLRRPRDRIGGLAVRALSIGVASACLFAIGVPLATATAVRQSQNALAAGDPARALADARAATRLEPRAASAQIQLALVLELQRNLPGGLAAARRATTAEPDNWSGWLVLSRLEAEADRPTASLVAFRRARMLNPRSPLFSR